MKYDHNRLQHRESLAKNLSVTTYIAHGSKIMIFGNKNTRLAFANGTTGVARLPCAIIIECNDYQGPQVFTYIGKVKWVTMRRGGARRGEENSCYEKFPI